MTALQEMHIVTSMCLQNYGPCHVTTEKVAVVLRDIIAIFIVMYTIKIVVYITVHFKVGIHVYPH